MRLKLDENLSRHLKDQLIALGHDTLTASDEGLLARADTDVAGAAKAEQRMLFTLDLDFSDLRRYPPGHHPGIVLFRPGAYGILGVSRFVLEHTRELNLDELVGCLVVASPGRVRVQRPNDQQIESYGGLNA
jgi:predicted nuclease of predicted toxin-antitoxin system